MNRPVESMFRAVQYIEAHLQSETDIAQIAEAVGYSLFYFIRTFDQVVQHTPYDYLMRRRLTEAALTLGRAAGLKSLEPVVMERLAKPER